MAIFAEMNLVFIILILVMLILGVNGYKNGLVKEVISIISFAFVVVFVVLIAYALKSYTSGAQINYMIAVVLIMLVGIVHKLVKGVLFSIKLLSKLPVVHFANKLVGFVLGLAEGIIIFWLVDSFTKILMLGMVEEYFVKGVEASGILTMLSSLNPLLDVVSKINL